MKSALAIDIGGSKISIGIISQSGKILYEVTKKIIMPYDGDDVVFTIKEMLKHPDFSDISDLPVGVTIPGTASPDTGYWLYSPFSGITDYPIVRKLSETFTQNIFIENDVNAAALGELLFGNGKDCSDFFWMTVSNGIGGAIIINNTLYRGFYGFAGEIGHNYQNSEYGNEKVCKELEDLAAGPAILKQYQILTNTTCNDTTAKEIALYAKQNDIQSKKVYSLLGHYLGKELASIANILNPGIIIIGGSIATDFALFKDSLYDSFNRYRYHPTTEQVQIIRSKFPQKAALYGAAALVFKNC
ncbi:MAG: ROK family protein [Bacteroidetes bacterium]|nr:ROK family protein [Bacteroidota bacterium]